MTDITAPRPPQNLSARISQLGRDAAYLLLSWPLMLMAFIIVVVLFSLGVGLAILWVGVPVLVASLLVSRGAATVERRAVSTLTGTDLPSEPYIQAPLETTWIRRLTTPLRDPQSWLDLLWVVAGFAVATFTWSVTVTWLAGAAATVLGPISTLVLSQVLPADSYTGLAELLGMPFPLLSDIVIQFTFGLGFAVTAPWMLRGLAGLQTGLSTMMLSTRARERASREQLRDSRAAVRRAETDALRRLERDIHDGPQQRLVRLTMDLARAKRHTGTDPERAEELLAEAMVQAQETLDELRQLSRGIAPPVLVDRGLEAAITEAAARSGVPVTVFADLPEQLPDHVETAAYFLISEALVNVNKHSDAQEAQVFAAIQDDELYLRVNDNGHGGASLAKGHGLAGLAERLRGVDAALSVTSPAGGPTDVEAVIPCAS